MKKHQYYVITAALFGIWGQLIFGPMKYFCLVASIFSGILAIVYTMTGE